MRERSVAILHKDLSYAVVGCAQRVHSSLGPGFPESVYKRALSHELAKQRIPFECEAEFEVGYDGVICGRFRVDLYVDRKIVLELKAVEGLCDEHGAQLLSYLRAVGARLGLLLNFGQSRLAVKRIVN